MMKNDYRRSLIMLRVHAQGYSGHVRLERRTLMGNLYAVINEPSGAGTLRAMLIRPVSRGEYAAAGLGELRRDGRGQASLAYSFDPRNINGRPLEDYRLIVIVARDRQGRCSVVLSGNVNGSCDADWNAVRRAACGKDREDAAEPCAPEPAEQEEGTEETRVPELSVEPYESHVEERGWPVPERKTETEPAFDLPKEPVRTVYEERPLTAAEALGLDASVPWPGVAEQIREFFAAQPALEQMPEDGYTYVAAPMPEESGFDTVRIGLRVRQGVPVAIAYALPCGGSSELPRGLDNYVRREVDGEGWWTVETDPYTGECLS